MPCASSLAELAATSAVVAVMSPMQLREVQTSRDSFIGRLAQNVRNSASSLHVLLEKILLAYLSSCKSGLVLERLMGGEARSD